MEAPEYSLYKSKTETGNKQTIFKNFLLLTLPVAGKVVKLA